MNKKYELVHEVGSTVNLTAVVKDLDIGGEVRVTVEDITFWLSAGEALKLGLIKEVVRKPQVRDVYKDDSGWEREIVALSEGYVWYWASSEYIEKDAHGARIEAIENWGELQ